LAFLARIRRILVRLLVGGVAAVAFIGVAGLVLELLNVVPPADPPLMIWEQQQDRELIGSQGHFRFHPRWLWEPRPGSLFFDEPINEEGYRGPIYPVARTGRLRIVAMGDSSTFGYGHPEERSWPRVLERLLREQGLDAEVINFGVIGYTAVQGLELFRGRVRAYRPDVLVVAFGTVNERFNQGIPDVQKIQLTSDWRYRVETILARLSVFRWLRATLKPPRPLQWEEAENAPPSVRVPPKEFRDSLAELDRMQREDGHRLVIVCPPRMEAAEVEFPETVFYTDSIHHIAAKLGTPLADVYDRFRLSDSVHGPGEKGQLPRTSALFRDSVHPSADGHRLYATVVAATLREAGLLAPAPGSQHAR
jgi:lysophospholipase L1-like esterase